MLEHLLEVMYHIEIQKEQKKKKRFISNACAGKFPFLFLAMLLGVLHSIILS